MHFTKFSKEAVCELLIYLVDHESFSSVSKLEGVSRKDVQEVLSQLVEGLKKEILEEVPAKKPNYTEYDLSSHALSVISCLSPREEILLFKSFKLL